MVELRVLGPVELVGVALGPKERALLCRLVVAFGRVVSEAELIVALWPGSPPRTAAKTLQGNVLRLRKALVLAEARAESAVTKVLSIGSVGGGYVLTSRPDALDVVCFESLLAGARQAISRRDHEAVSEMLREALLLWRGRPFGELGDCEWAMAETRRLEELAVAAREDLMDSELARGRHHGVVAELEPMVAAEPFRERSWEQLALALYRCGRQGDALRTIQRARSVLTLELGVGPGPSLKRLETAILVQDASLDLAAARRDPSATPHRRTATFLFTDIVGSTERWERDALDMRSALDRTTGCCARASMPTAARCSRASATPSMRCSRLRPRRSRRRSLGPGRCRRSAGTVSLSKSAWRSTRVKPSRSMGTGAVGR